VVESSFRLLSFGVVVVVLVVAMSVCHRLPSSFAPFFRFKDHGTDTISDAIRSLCRRFAPLSAGELVGLSMELVRPRPLQQPIHCAGGAAAQRVRMLEPRTIARIPLQAAYPDGDGDADTDADADAC
jgi:hypothetical protein